jgi:putative flippase GtrA
MSEPTARSLVAESYRRIFSGRIMRFAAVGGIVTVFFMALNALFGRVAGLRPEVAFLVSYPPALALHFLLNKLWTFGDKTSTTHHQLGEYLFSVVVTFLIQWPAFTLLQKVLGLPGWVAAGGANLLQMSASYGLLRWKVFHGRPASDRGAPSNPWHRLALLFTILGGSALIYWTAFAGWNAPQFGKAQDDYYNYLVSGFRKGSLAMDVQVPDALIHAENPWDPSKRPPGIALHDASYFNGHYYLYFGVVPAVLLFWPYRVLLGSDISYAFATFLYIEGAFLLSAWLWLRVLRDRFPRAGLLIKLAGPIALGLCAGQLTLVRRISIWELPIAAGHFHMVCFLVSAYLALRARRSWPALAAAGLSLGLAIGCRPTLVAVGPALAVLVIASGWDGSFGAGARVRRFLASMAAAGIPFAAVLSGLLAYNYLRFGRALEFGLNYQLTAGYEAKARHFALSFAPFNLDAYFARAPQLGRYFPFLHPMSWVKPPEGYYGIEFVYGALVVCPLIWLALLSSGLFRKAGEKSDRPLVLVVLAMALGTTLILSFFNTAAARYVPDFLPWWLWLALLGSAWLEDCLDARPSAWAALFHWAFGLSFGVTLVFAFLQSVALHGILENKDPEAYRRLSRVFDSPAAAWERMRGENVGPVTMDVTFPGDMGPVLEPLVVAGVEYEADYFFVYYKAKSVVRLGYESSGDAPVFSPDLAVEPGRTYHLRFEAGCLFPPEGHPVYSGWSPHQVHAAKSWVKIDIDGKRVVSQQRQFHEGSPEFCQFGRDERSGAFGRRFSGTLTHITREALVAAQEPKASSGDVILRVTLPDEIVPGSQPLVVAGQAGSAELVGLRLLDAGWFVLTYEKWGGGYWESEPVAVPPGREASFRIRLGELLAPSGPYPQGLFKNLLIVWMNGQPVWWRREFGGLGPHPAVEVLTNQIGSSAMRISFMGNLLDYEREPLSDWRPGPFRTLEADLTGHGKGIEPVITTGVTGSADVLAIEWLPHDRARLLLDHWSHAAYSSHDFPWNPKLMHHLKLTLPSLAALDSMAEHGGHGVLTADVDGVNVWTEDVPYYSASSSTATFGRNTVGSSMAAPELSCTLGDLRQDFSGRQ